MVIGLSINRDLIEARIREINDSIEVMKQLVSKRYEEMSLHELLSLRYLLIQLVEASSSICIHILLNLFNEKPEGYPECFSRLGAKGIIPKELAIRLSAAARLRNLLVHRYWTISDERVYEDAREGLKDFTEFISYIRKYIGEL